MVGPIAVDVRSAMGAMAAPAVVSGRACGRVGLMENARLACLPPPPPNEL